MKKLMAIGEALIDFSPSETGKAIKEVRAFEPKPGGAPANVTAAYAKLGGQSAMITQLGMDPFGDKIIETLMESRVSCDYVLRTDKANTSLAFVALNEDGNREFSFYRKPGADMLLDPAVIQKDWFIDTFVLHFCSVSLGEYPMKEAHKTAIRYAKEAGAFISFDPNLRFMLWDDKECLKAAVHEFIPMADIIKISDEEVKFITGKENIEDALDILFTGDVKLIIYTCGADGAYAYTKRARAFAPGIKVEAVDTTGAGDAFIGSFLYQLSKDDVNDIEYLTADQLKRYLTASNQYCSESVMKKGAIESYPEKLAIK